MAEDWFHNQDKYRQRAVCAPHTFRVGPIYSFTRKNFVWHIDFYFCVWFDVRVSVFFWHAALFFALATDFFPQQEKFQRSLFFKHNRTKSMASSQSHEILTKCCLRHEWALSNQKVSLIFTSINFNLHGINCNERIFRVCLVLITSRITAVCHTAHSTVYCANLQRSTIHTHKE